jgi:hypothetical protein
MLLKSRRRLPMETQERRQALHFTILLAVNEDADSQTWALI